MKKAAIIGGGVTGLAAALRLKNAGFQPLVYEAGQRCGGVIQTRSENGFTYECGPNTFMEQPEIMKLVEDLGLGDSLKQPGPAAKNRFIVRNGTVLPVPTSPPAFIRTPLLSAKGKMRLLAEPFIGRAKGEHEESLAAFIQRRLGREALEYLVDPLVSGIHAGDPATLSAPHSFPQLAEWEREHGSLFKGMMRSAKKRKAEGRSRPRLLSFENGLQTLPDGMAAALKGRIYLETKVKSLTGADGKWQVLAERHDREIKDSYDAVVLALPAPALASLSLQTGADDALTALREIVHPALRVTLLGYPVESVRHPLDGFGVLIPHLEERRILGALFSSTLFPGRAPENHVLLTVFSGGARHKDHAQLEESTAVQEAVSEVRALGLVAGNPVFTRSILWPRSIPQYHVGYGKILTLMEKFEEKHPGVFIAGQCRDGISVPNCVASGIRQADRALAHLGPAVG